METGELNKIKICQHIFLINSVSFILYLELPDRNRTTTESRKSLYDVVKKV